MLIVRDMPQEFNYHTRSMGCDFDMTFIAESSQRADAYFTHAVEIAQLYEKTFSRFDPESELSRLNVAKSLAVSQDFLTAYHIAQDLYTQTQGSFNPLLQVSRIGYNQSFDDLEKEQPFSELELSYDANPHNISLRENVLSLQEGHQLDFGGYLKGYVVEKIAHDITDCPGLIINIGGDLYVKGHDHNDQPFVIEIVHPTDPSQNTSLALVDYALCTSGTYKRTWLSNGGEMHHIVNPSTKRSSTTDILSVSVLHKNGALADALATCAVTHESHDAKDFLTTHNAQFLIVCTNGAIIQSQNFE